MWQRHGVVPVCVPGYDAMTCNVHTQLTSRRFASVVELKKLAQTALLAYGSEEQDRYLDVALPFADGISAADKHRLGQLGRSNWPGLVTELLKPGVYGGHAVMAAVCLATDSNIIIHRPKPGDGLKGKHLQSHAIIRLETGDKKPEPTWLIADTFDFEVGSQPSHVCTPRPALCHIVTTCYVCSLHAMPRVCMFNFFSLFTSLQFNRVRRGRVARNTTRGGGGGGGGKREYEL